MLRRFRCSQPKAIRKQSIPETSRDSDSTQALNSTRQQSEPDTFNAALSDASDATARRVLQFEGGSRYRPYIS
jgi:hypothetical protein